MLQHAPIDLYSLDSTIHSFAARSGRFVLDQFCPCARIVQPMHALGISRRHRNWIERLNCACTSWARSAKYTRNKPKPPTTTTTTVTATAFFLDRLKIAKRKSQRRGLTQETLQQTRISIELACAPNPFNLYQKPILALASE